MAISQTGRARTYLAKLPPAIAGSGRHAATFKAACVAVEFGLNESDAWELLCEWNATHCQPHWTENELRHKLADARQVAMPKEKFNQSSNLDNVTSRWKNSSVRTADAKTKRATADFSASFFDQSTAEGQFSALATLRGISFEGVRLAYERDLLQFGQHQGRAAWFILDGSRRGAQARRMDGGCEGMDVARITGGLAGRRRGVRAVFNRRLLRGKPGLARGSSLYLDGKPRTRFWQGFAQRPKLDQTLMDQL